VIVYREFVVPTQDEFVREFRIEPCTELVTGVPPDETLRMPVIDPADDERFIFTFDVPGRSVRFRRLTCGVAVMEIFPEGTTLLAIGWRGETRCFTIDFETDSLGRLEVRLGDPPHDCDAHPLQMFDVAESHRESRCSSMRFELRQPIAATCCRIMRASSASRMSRCAKVPAGRGTRAGAPRPEWADGCR